MVVESAMRLVGADKAALNAGIMDVVIAQVFCIILCWLKFLTGLFRRTGGRSPPS